MRLIVDKETISLPDNEDDYFLHFDLNIVDIVQEDDLYTLSVANTQGHEFELQMDVDEFLHLIKKLQKKLYDKVLNDAN